MNLGLDSHYRQRKYKYHNHRSVNVSEIEIGERLIKKKRGGKIQILQKAEKVYYIPILESIQALLSHDHGQVYTLIARPHNYTPDGFMCDVCDGEYFHEHNFGRANALMIDMQSSGYHF